MPTSEEWRQVPEGEGVYEVSNLGRVRTNDRHGTTNGYNNWKCRCPLCKKANSEYYKGYKKRRGA